MPWWSPFVPAIATLVSVIAAGIYATVTIRNNREIARLKATLDLIEKAESSEFYRDLAVAFRNALAPDDPTKKTPLDAILRPKNPYEIDQRTKIVFFLNHYELIATGFERGVLDKSFYASSMRGAVVHDWRAAEPFVIALRWKDPSPHPSPKKIYDTGSGRLLPDPVSPARAAELCSARMSEADVRIARRLRSNRHDPAGIAERSTGNRMRGSRPWPADGQERSRPRRELHALYPGTRRVSRGENPASAPHAPAAPNRLTAPPRAWFHPGQ
ncbi:MAG: DUF4760 domain-containing protein [Methylobacterium frigidaeris]